MQHWAILTDNRSKKAELIEKLLANSVSVPGFESLLKAEGEVFSSQALDDFIEEEARHDNKILTSDTPQALHTFSSGERKKALLQHLLQQTPDFLILDNPLDNLDKPSKKRLREVLSDLSTGLKTIQFLSRKSDLLPFAKKFGFLDHDTIYWYPSFGVFEQSINMEAYEITRNIPGAPSPLPDQMDSLVEFRKVSVSYGNKAVLRDIEWYINRGEFWQLAGRNGSGKTTLLTMITGDNPKAYGEDLYLFGRRRGSGESVWEIKEKIGYFTPAMTDRFRGYHSLENMLISGLMDSVGLYIIPTEIQKRVAREWLELIGLHDKKHAYFHELTAGQQRLIMVVRAMIKHPALLILDEPTVGLDDHSADMVVQLVNKMAAESETAIIFVSHREEPGLKARKKMILEMSELGSSGHVEEGT